MQKLFGVMAASAVILNALYIIACIYMSPSGIKYPLLHFTSSGTLLLAVLLYGPALIAVSIWLASQLGKQNAQD